MTPPSPLQAAPQLQNRRPSNPRSDLAQDFSPSQTPLSVASLLADGDAHSTRSHKMTTRSLSRDPIWTDAHSVKNSVGGGVNWNPHYAMQPDNLPPLVRRGSAQSEMNRKISENNPSTIFNNFTLSKQDSRSPASSVRGRSSISSTNAFRRDSIISVATSVKRAHSPDRDDLDNGNRRSPSTERDASIRYYEGSRRSSHAGSGTPTSLVSNAKSTHRSKVSVARDGQLNQLNGRVASEYLEVRRGSLPAMHFAGSDAAESAASARAHATQTRPSDLNIGSISRRNITPQHSDGLDGGSPHTLSPSASSPHLRGPIMLRGPSDSLNASPSHTRPGSTLSGTTSGHNYSPRSAHSLSLLSSGDAIAIKSDAASLKSPHASIKNQYNLSLAFGKEMSFHAMESPSISTPATIEEHEDTFARMIAAQDPLYKLERDRWIYSDAEHLNISLRDISTAKKGRGFLLTIDDSAVAPVVLAPPRFHKYNLLEKKQHQHPISDRGSTPPNDEPKKSLGARLRRSLLSFGGALNRDSESPNYEPPWLMMHAPPSPPMPGAMSSPNNASTGKSSVKKQTPRASRAVTEDLAGSDDSGDEDEHPWWFGVPGNSLCMLIPRKAEHHNGRKPKHSLLVSFVPMPITNKARSNSRDTLGHWAPETRLHHVQVSQRRIKRGRKDDTDSGDAPQESLRMGSITFDAFKVVARYVIDPNAEDVMELPISPVAEQASLSYVVAQRSSLHSPFEMVPEGLEALGLGSALGGRGEDDNRSETHHGSLTDEGNEVVGLIWSGSQACMHN